MKTKINLLKTVLIFTFFISSLSCSNDDGPQTESFAFSITKENSLYSFNHKLAIASPGTMGVCLSKYSALHTTPASIGPNSAEGCGIALTETIAGDVEVSMFFTDATLADAISVSDGVYTTVTSQNQNNPKSLVFVITDSTFPQGYVTSQSGTLELTKNAARNAVNVKGTLLLSNGQTVSFSTQGLDIPYSHCL